MMSECNCRRAGNARSAPSDGGYREFVECLFGTTVGAAWGERTGDIAGEGGDGERELQQSMVFVCLYANAIVNEAC